MTTASTILVLGLGNRLMGDDAAGPLVLDALKRDIAPGDDRVRWRDGGTIGLALLPEIEDARALIVVDAARFGGMPGAVQVFDGDEMDALLRGGRQSVHAVALADLLGAAALRGHLPARRALVAVQPRQIGLGLQPTSVVRTAIPQLAQAVRERIAAWGAHEVADQVHDTAADAARPEVGASSEPCGRAA